jgi:signal transduction histidine kinase
MATANGVSRYDGKSFANYTTSQGLAHNIILNITEDKEGNLWIGTEGGGVSRYDGKSFTSFNTTHGLPDNVVTSIVVDSSGKIIFGTNFGIGVLTSFTQTSTEKKAGNSIPAQNNLSNEELIYYTPQIEVYNSYTGYPVKDVNYGQNAMLQENNGIVWIGTGADKTGLVRFDYSAIKKRDDPPEVMLQTIRINNENLTWYNLLPASRREELKPDSNSTAPHIIEELAIFGKVLNESERDSIRVKFGNIKFDSIDSFYSIPENLVLPYKHNSISFDFAAIEPARPYLLKYQYILEGYDEDWSKESNQSSATYGNLHEGSYTFKLKAKSPDRVWSVPMLYHFKVLPPWYRSWWAYIIYILVGVFFISAIIRWRTKSLKQEKIKLEEKISQRTTQLEQKSIELAKSLENLKATQTQLIQSEKMASLGELTAGIAHEIQNPLNFVNNFSEVNTELIGELKKEIEDRNYAVLKDIADDLENNMGKITEHGKRAGSIVKSMLLHSRTSSSQKEMTDINALVEEYVRLAFHGMRAKDKSFNAKLITSYDPGAGSLDLVPQDIGRVLLNLLNNAFYAVNERRKIEGNGYEPEVSVETKRSGERIQISVADNGKGVPENLLNKIFQPFFTTKPAGEGTGLGLSLSYDIVKAHGGTLKIESTEVGLTQFTIELPVWQVPAGRA